MSFTENDKLKALAIVNIFETSRPMGDYAACVVLDDGAGISYGICQFTHRSGSLAAVVERYLDRGTQVGKAVLTDALPRLKKTTAVSVKRLAADDALKNTLRAVAITSEMKQAQREIAFEKYLQPALEICETKEFVLPLSLAVIYDSLNHGSFEFVSARVTPLGVILASTKDAEQAEMAWITEYVRVRDRWLRDVRRLNATRYRTKFFLDQIAIGNWQLRLPVTVHGFKLMESHILATSDEDQAEAETPSEPVPTKSIFTSAGEAVSTAAEKFDRIDNVVTTVTSRKDAAKSLWTTVVGTVSQAAWAIFGVVAGMPREVWFGVAMIAALLMLAYLYRQIELGRIREVQKI